MRALLRKFMSDKRGNFAITAAIAILPLFAAAGLGLDLANGYSARTKLNNAADSAVLAALQSALKDLKTKGMSKTYPAQELLGNAMMVANIEQEYGISLKSFKVEVTNTGGALEARAIYRAELDTTIMRVFNRNEVSLSNEVLASSRLDQKMSIYMLLDNTPSMGVAATNADISKMVAATPDKCAFACHADNNGDNYYNLAKAIGVNMRIDIVRDATQKLMDEIKAKQFFPGQFKVGVYSFGKKAEKLELTEVAAPSSDFETQKSLTSQLDLMSIPYQGYDNDQQTDFDKTLKSLRQTIKQDEAKGDDAEKIVFVVTDGVGDANKPYDCTKNKVNGTRCIEPLDIKACDQVKKQGYKLAVLYTTYLPLTTNSFYNTWVKPFQPNIAGTLASCATPGLFAEVGFGDSLPDAMSDLLNSATTMPRLVY
jgi:Flp pilus assembly protein TadG